MGHIRNRGSWCLTHKLVVWPWASPGLSAASKNEVSALGGLCVFSLLKFCYFQLLWDGPRPLPGLFSCGSPPFLPPFTSVPSASALHPLHFPGHPLVSLRWLPWQPPPGNDITHLLGNCFHGSDIIQSPWQPLGGQSCSEMGKQNSFFFY